MKGDFTRFTFDPRKHYSGVRMQQGRVLLDSDWNEQADIFDHRSEIEAKDIIGTSGCPADEAGFGIVTNIGDLTAEEQNRLTEEDKESIEALDPGNFLITAGRYYVDGILCENEQAVMYTDQRHEPEPLPVRSSETGEISFPYFPYVVYLDVWKRHVSVMEDPEIRETALGGPDTTTRIETAWQVRSFMPTLEVPFNSCIDVSEHIPALSNGRLTVELTSPVAAKASKCSMAPKDGYQGLENRLYRVEIHDSGRPFGWPRFIGIEENTGVCRFDYPILPDDKRDDGKDGLIVVEEKSPDGLSWKQGQMVEIFVPGTENGTLARVEEVEEAEGEKAQLKLNLDISKLGLPENLRVHRVATFKWSRDNGSVAYSIETIPNQPKKVKVKSLGQDKLLSLRGGDCVEILGDTTEFRCEPGTMAVISENGADEVNRELTLDQDVSRHKDENNPKIRRWDRSSSSSPDDMISPITLDQAELEDGIAVRFSVGPRDKYEELPSTIFKSGDYWTFAARSKEGKLKELKDAPPDGIEHHYCSLAKIQAINAVTSEGSLNTILDCRKRFPSSKDIFSLYYLGGDGQDGWPGRRLVYPLMVGVAMGKWPVANAHVDFIVISGDGTIERIEPPNTVDEEEKAGVYCAIWTLGGSYPQVAKAVLLDTQNNPVGIPIYFSANLNLAEFVEYIPPEACNKMSGILDVQSAINSLCPANILYYVGGAGQDGLPNQVLPQKLQVMVADSRGPVLSSMPVKFTVARGVGKVQLEGGRAEKECISWTKDGIAECNWILGSSGDQQVETSLIDPGNNEPIAGIKPIRFSANLNLAAMVAYTPLKDCLKMSGISDVQSAINQLCPANILYAVSGNNQVGIPGETVTLLVGVADSRGPVLSKVQIQFRVLPEGKPELSIYKENGIYEWKWTLGTLPTQQAEASLLGPDGKTAVGLPVRFNAFLRTAENIAYRNVKLHLKDNTVQEALDKLCNDQSDFNITGVLVMGEDGQTMRLLDNGATVRADLLIQGGLTISCSENVDPISFRVDDLRTPACTLTIEEPYFLPRTECVIGYHHLDLLGDAGVTKKAPSRIIWMPSIDSLNLLNAFSYYCSNQTEFEMDRGLILAHLVVKGNFIRSAENLDKYLDGDSFAIRPTTSGTLSNSIFPSGDGRAGGDFEMWLWISTPMTLNITPISDIRMGSLVTTKVKGTVNMNIAAPIDMVINLSGICSNNNITFSVEPSTTIKKDQNTADFSLTIQKGRVTSGTTSINLAATLNRWKTIATSITVNVII